MTLVSSTGILLRSHPYGDTSRIVRFLTPQHGIVAVLAKGIHRTGNRAGDPLETFGEGTLTFRLQPDRDLHTLRDYQAGAGSMALGRDPLRFTGASLMAEILLANTFEQGDPALYGWVKHVFSRLATVDRDAVPSWVLSGVWRMLSHLGFPPTVDVCVRCGGSLADQEGAAGFDRFVVAEGGICCYGCRPEADLPRLGPGARTDLIALVRGAPPVPLRGDRSHLRLLDAYCAQHLDSTGKGFRSFSVMAPLLDRSQAPT